MSRLIWPTLLMAIRPPGGGLFQLYRMSFQEGGLHGGTGEGFDSDHPDGRVHFLQVGGDAGD